MYESDMQSVTVRSDEEKAVDTPQDNFSEAPDGGFSAWLVTAGAAAAIFCTMGFTNVFGVFQAYYLFHQMPNQSADNIAWIGSVQAWLIFASGVIGGPLFDRYGTWVIRPAAITYIFAIMMTSLCQEYWQFMLAQGLLTGLSNGLVIFPAMAAVTQWFDKNTGAAMGIAMAGSSIGAVIFPIMLSNLLTKTSLGFGWSLRIVGFLMMPFLLFAVVTVRARLPPRKTQIFIVESFKKPTYLLLIAALFFGFIGMFVPMFLLPTYAITKGMDDTLASYLVAILNGASTFGRIIPGVLGDKFGRINSFVFSALATCIIIFCWPLAEGTGNIIGLTIAFGFFSGAIISAGSVSLTLCADGPHNVGKYLGVGVALASFSSLLGPPVSGAMVDRYHGFHEVSYFAGAVTLMGSMLALSAKIFTPKGLFGKV